MTWAPLASLSFHAGLFSSQPEMSCCGAAPGRQRSPACSTLPLAAADWSLREIQDLFLPSQGVLTESAGWEMLSSFPDLPREIIQTTTGQASLHPSPVTPVTSPCPCSSASPQDGGSLFDPQHGVSPVLASAALQWVWMALFMLPVANRLLASSQAAFFGSWPCTRTAAKFSSHHTAASPLLA